MIVFFMVACSDKGLTTYNSTPEISIQSHGNNTQVEPGSILFRAQASDANHDAQELEVRWFLSDDDYLRNNALKKIINNLKFTNFDYITFKSGGRPGYKKAKKFDMYFSDIPGKKKIL